MLGLRFFLIIVLLLVARLDAVFFSAASLLKQKPFLENSIPVLGMKPKRRWYEFCLFFKVDRCSAISFKRSRRELSIDMAEHRPMLKNYQNAYYLRFSFIPKTDMLFPKRG